MEVERLVSMYNNILSHSPPRYSTSVPIYSAPILCQALYQHHGELTLGGLLAVLTIWFERSITSNTGYFSKRVCTTLFGNFLFTCVPPVGSLRSRDTPLSPIKCTEGGTVIGPQWLLMGRKKAWFPILKILYSSSKKWGINCPWKERCREKVIWCFYRNFMLLIWARRNGK